MFLYCVYMDDFRRRIGNDGKIVTVSLTWLHGSYPTNGLKRNIFNQIALLFFTVFLKHIYNVYGEMKGLSLFYLKMYALLVKINE